MSKVKLTATHKSLVIKNTVPDHKISMLLLLSGGGLLCIAHHACLDSGVRTLCFHVVKASQPRITGPYNPWLEFKDSTWLTTVPWLVLLVDTRN